jgi:hypothetical protein
MTVPCNLLHPQKITDSLGPPDMIVESHTHTHTHTHTRTHAHTHTHTHIQENELWGRGGVGVVNRIEGSNPLEPFASEPF